MRIEVLEPATENTAYAYWFYETSQKALATIFVILFWPTFGGYQ